MEALCESASPAFPNATALDGLPEDTEQAKVRGVGPGPWVSCPDRDHVHRLSR